MNFAADLPASHLTTAEIAFGDPVTSQLETGADSDWFRIDLVQGERYVFDLAGTDDASALADPLLRLYQNGTLVAEDDDSGAGAASRILITAPQTGTFYLEAASPAGQTGRYQLDATNLSQPTTLANEPTPVDAIDWGTHLETNSIDVYFAEQGEAFAGHTSFGWTDYEVQQTLAAMAEIEAVADITFNRVSSPADADLNLVIASPIFFSAVMYPPEEQNAGIGIFSRAALTADGGFVQGGSGFRIMLHELSHGLGLAHPHDHGGESEILDGVSSTFGDYGDFDLNQGVFTTLSYNYGYRSETGREPDKDYGKAGTLSPLDIALVQDRYGARRGTNDEATTYDLISTNGAGTFYAAIWDTGGIDWITHDGAADAIIDLRAATLQYEEGGGGFVSRVDGVFGGYTIANGVLIENARGGRGADTITGNDAANHLLGGDGDDRLAGGLGIDILTGGAGADTFVFGVDDHGATITDFDGNDSLEFATADLAATAFTSLSTSDDDATLRIEGTRIVLENAGTAIFSLSGNTISSLSQASYPDPVFSSDPGETGADLSNTSGAQVYRVYQATLNRAPDTDGFEFWAGKLESGSRSLQQVVTGFMNSGEFQNTYGNLDNTGFVTLLYNNVLDRAPDEGGQNAWLDALNNGTPRAQVVTGFSESAEFKIDTSAEASAYAEALEGRADSAFYDDVYRLYQATLDRAPNAAGLATWSEQLADGRAYTSVAAGFTNSDEFRNTYGTLDDTAFVNQLYRNALGREVDMAGRQGWLDVIDNGGTREDVVRGFAQSGEFVGNTAAAFKAYMKAGGGDTLEGGSGNDTLYSGTTADTFVFDASEDGSNTVLQLDTWDTLQFEGFGYSSAAEARAQMSAVGSDVRFADEGVIIIFAGATLSTMQEVDYLFA